MTVSNACLLKLKSNFLLPARCLALLLACVALSLVGAHAGSVVTVDTNNVLLINGRKTFMIGMSPGPPNNGVTPAGKDALQELHDAGVVLFRMNQTGNWDSTVIAQQQAALDWAGQHGMYCWVNLRELSQFSSTDTTTPASLRNIVDTFRNHPALGLWKNFDEAWWGGVSVANLSNGFYVIHQEDTNHPVVQTHAPRGTVADLQPYNVAADVLALDIYPVAVPPPSNPPITNTYISQVGDWTKVLGQIANGQKEYWLIEQIAFSGTTPPGKTLVFPTFAQSRYMAYQAIVNGARGLLFFGGNITATLNSVDAPFGWNWTFWTNVLRQVVLEVGQYGQISDALVATNSALPITISGTTVPDIEFCVREVPPSALYILACKREGTNANVTFSGLPPSSGFGDVLYESGRTVLAQNGQFTDTFAPFDVHVYRFYLTNQPPSITSQPQSCTNAAGTTAAFNVTASGTPPLAYQWLKNGLALSNGGNLSGASGTTLTLSNVQSADTGSYTVVVSNNAGSTTSALAALTVPAPIEITGQPASVTNMAGSAAAFSVSITGSNPQFRWRKNNADLADGGNVSGSGTATLTLAGVLKSDAAAYTVVITNQFNSVTSLSAALEVIDPAVTNQPSTQTVPQGGTAVFAVGAAGTPSLSYRWKKDGLDLNNGGKVWGVTASILTITNVQNSDVAGYSVAVSNSFGFAVSAPASLTLTPVPVITDQPDSRTNNAGTLATFAVGAQGSGLTYQWLRSGTNLANGGNVSGATTPTLALSPVFSADAAPYSVVVSNASGSVASAAASLSVLFPMPYYEPFSYPVGANLGGQTNYSFLTWSDVGTSTSGPYVTNVAGNLTYSGLPASTGNSVRFGGLGKSARFSFAPGNTFTNGTVYYSFLLKVTDTNGLTSSGIFIAGFNNTMGAQANQPSVIGTRLYIRSVTGGFNLGVAKNSSTTSDWVWDSRVFTNNQVIFLVGGYTLNAASAADDVSTLWINPSSSTFGAATAPAPSLTATTGSDISPLPLASFVLFQRDATEPAGMIADELRIGQTWASVTATAPPMGTMLTSFARLGNGAFQFAYTDGTFQSGVVYASTNLSNWTSLGAATQISPGQYQFTDNAATNYPRRFYQLRAQ